MYTHETRGKAYEEIKPNRQRRYYQIIEILEYYDQPMTAKEIAVKMYNRGYTLNMDRNNSSPRITELVNRGIVRECGKMVCKFSGKTVTTFELVRGEK